MVEHYFYTPLTIRWETPFHKALGRKTIALEISLDFFPFLDSLCELYSLSILCSVLFFDLYFFFIDRVNVTIPLKSLRLKTPTSGEIHIKCKHPLRTRTQDSAHVHSCVRAGTRRGACLACARVPGARAPPPFLCLHSLEEVVRLFNFTLWTLLNLQFA